MKNNNLENEVWVDIKGYEGLYAVSNKGRVKSLSREYISSRGQKRKVKGRLLKNSPDSYGYVRVTLSNKDFKQKVTKVHILVAEAFLENDDPDNKIHVTMIDGDKTNVGVDNLEWATVNETAIKGNEITIEKRYGNQKEEI